MTPDGSLLHPADRLPDLLAPCDVLTAVNDLTGFRPHYVWNRWCFLIDFPPESEKSAEHYGHADGKYDPKARHRKSCSIPAHRLAPITVWREISLIIVRDTLAEMGDLERACFVRVAS